MWYHRELHMSSHTNNFKELLLVFIYLSIFVCAHTCMCVGMFISTGVCAHAMVCIWRSENNVKGSVFFCEFWGRSTAPQATNAITQWAISLTQLLLLLDWYLLYFLLFNELSLFDFFVSILFLLIIDYNFDFPISRMFTLTTLSSLTFPLIPDISSSLQVPFPH